MPTPLRSKGSILPPLTSLLLFFANITIPAFSASQEASPLTPASTASILPPGWNPKAAADAVLAGLVKITAPEVKGAHDAEMAIVGNRAFIVAEVNDVRASESAEWTFIYSALSVVDLQSLRVEAILPFAKSEQVFENTTLPAGSCFVPRILQLNPTTLRCFFASESPAKRESKTWYRDFDIPSLSFENRIQPARLKTAEGISDMEPKPFHSDAVRFGFTRAPKNFGLYIFDSFKVFGGRTYAALNNYPGGQNALAVLNPEADTFEVLGHFNDPPELKLTESAINQLPDGSWLAVCRQEGGSANYVFATSKDGRTWTPAETRPLIPNGTSSKPTFDKFGQVYYLGWQEKTRINNANRSVFNVEVSMDCLHWERKYRFETEQSFQYPTFRKHDKNIWLCVTQGDSDPSRKERIMFEKLE